VSAWLLGRRAAIRLAVLSLEFGLSLAMLESGGIEFAQILPDFTN
jgi:hypothetical protein